MVLEQGSKESTREPFRNPGPDEIRSLLEKAKTIAVVGYSPSASRPSNGIARALQRLGYRVIPVRPGMEEALGEKVYADIAAIPGTVDIVDVFRDGRHVPEIVAQCLERGIGAIWMQEGCVNTEAAMRARDAGMTVVMDRCILRDHTRLLR